MTRRLPLLIAAVLTCRLLAPAPLFAQAPAPTPAAAPPKPAFSFYGLRFGMTKDEVTLAFRSFDGRRVVSPGHGMESLEIAFDREETVMEFRAVYLKPGDPLELIGLQRALREKSEELMNLRIQLNMRRLDNPLRVRETRREIAVLKTVINQKKGAR